MYILTSQFNTNPWTSHERLAANWQEQQEDISIFKTMEDAVEEAIRIAKEHQELLKVTKLSDYFEQKSKQIDLEITRSMESAAEEVKFLPLNRPIVDRQSGEPIGSTLFLIMHRRHVDGVVVETNDGAVMSLIGDDHCDLFEEQYRLLSEAPAPGVF